MLTVRVEDCGSADVKFITDGEKVHDVFPVRPPHVSSTEPKFAAVGVTITENVPLCPCSTVEEGGLTVTVKSGVGGGIAGAPASS